MADKRNNRKQIGVSAGNSATVKPTALTPPQSNGEITIFLSYTRADDAVYDMIRPFKEMLGHFIYAKSGRKIKTFLDQDSMIWGEVWRDRLEAEILGATVFIPLLSAAYLDSEICRMEFNRFQANATALGVKELLLPVLLLNAPAIFNENSTDDVVREAAARDWEIIEEAILSDAKSSAWKTTMARLADRFVGAYEAAEAKLANIEEADLAPLPIDSRVNTEDDDDDREDDEPGILEVTSSIEEGLKQLTESTLEMRPAIVDLGKAANSAGTLNDSPTTRQVQVWSLNTAHAFREPAEKVSQVGEIMFVATKEIDLDMRRFRRISLDLLPVNPDFAVGYNTAVQQLTGLDEVSAQLNNLLNQMKPAEYLSVALRKSLRPARRGLTRVTDSLRLIKTWQPIEIPEG